jgi:NitT/TauT family transport system substrate-binding protein
MVGVRLAFRGTMPSRRKPSMLRRTFLASAAALAAPAVVAPFVARGALGQKARTVRMGTAQTTTTSAAFLMADLLKPDGIELELVMFPAPVARMQAAASGEVDVGNGGLSAALQVAAKGPPLQVLANGCDGGWMVLGQPSIDSVKDLAGKKVGVQESSIGLVSLNWKLRQEGVLGKVATSFMDNPDQPEALSRGDVAAICCFEPFAALAEANGWGKRLWVPYDSPMGKTNLGLVASEKFVKADPELARKIVQAHVKATRKMASDSSLAIETTIRQFGTSREVAELSVKNLFFSADSGAEFVGGLKALAKLMIGDKMLEKEPDWGRFLNLGYV